MSSSLIIKRQKKHAQNTELPSLRSSSKSKHQWSISTLSTYFFFVQLNSITMRQSLLLLGMVFILVLPLISAKSYSVAVPASSSCSTECQKKCPQNCDNKCEDFPGSVWTKNDCKCYCPDFWREKFRFKKWDEGENFLFARWIFFLLVFHQLFLE